MRVEELITVIALSGFVAITMVAIFVGGIVLYFAHCVNRRQPPCPRCAAEAKRHRLAEQKRRQDEEQRRKMEIVRKAVNGG